MENLNNLNLMKNLYSKCISPICEKFNITRMEFDVLLFLANNEKYDTARDIVEVRGLTKSHVSSAIKDLTKKDLILKFYEKGNKKSLHLKPKSKSYDIIEMGRTAQKKYYDLLFIDFTDKEKEIFKKYLQKIYNNVRVSL